jgi:drug/metabolite transporter (DMT)-like permease
MWKSARFAAPATRKAWFNAKDIRVVDNMTSEAGTVRRDWTNLVAATYAITSTCIFAAIFMSGRFTGDAASPIQIMFLRYLGGLITVIVICLVTRQTWGSLQSAYRLSQFWRVFTGATGAIALIYGNAHMPLVDANAINLLRVVFVIILGMIILGERLTLNRTIGIAICVFGAAGIMVARGAFSGFGMEYLFPAGVVLVGSMFVAAEGLLIKILAVSDKPLVTIVHANTFGVLLLFIPAVLTWGSLGPVNLALLMLGPFAIMGQYLTIRAYAIASVSVLAPLSYSSLVFAALVGWAFFDEVPTLGVALGAATIAVGGIILALTRK